MAARSRPRLTSAGSKDCGAGGSLVSIAGRQVTAKAAIAPPISAAMASPPTIPGFGICPKLLLLWEALLAQIAGPRPRTVPSPADQKHGLLAPENRRACSPPGGENGDRRSILLLYYF